MTDKPSISPDLPLNEALAFCESDYYSRVRELLEEVQDDPQP